MIRTQAWRSALRADPLDWLLEPSHAAVRHLALRDLCDEPETASAVRRACAQAMRTRPIAPILDALSPEGWWLDGRVPYDAKGAKYRGWFWPLMFLEQMGADPRDRRVRRACRYAIDRGQAPGGGFGWSHADSGVPHCLNGNMLRAFIWFGFLDDERVRRAVAWEASAITGEGHERWYPGATSGPGFACGINGGLPCGWGAAKAVHGLAAIPPRRRTRAVRDGLAAGSEFLLSVDPATGGYPAASRISAHWFRLGFPSGYVADALEVGQALADLGKAKDPRLAGVVDLVLGKQGADGRWRNERSYKGRLWTSVDTPGRQSKWVTLRAVRFLRAALG